MNAFTLSPVERAQSLESVIREHADAADAECRLQQPVAQAMAGQGLYRLGASTAYGGEEADPITQIETLEAVAGFDGAAGWNLMIGIENFGLITPGCENCQDLFADPMMIMCSSTAAIGRAEKDGDGYRVNGRWQFVSGCHSSSLFGALVRLYENGEEVSGNVYALIEAPDFQIVENWDVSGMRGSGSHNVNVDDVWVPANRIVSAMNTGDNQTPLQRLPLGVRLSYNKVALSFGLARAGLDAFVELAEGKKPRFTSRTLRERATAQYAIAMAEVRLRASRALIMEQIADIWQKMLDGDEVSLKQRALFHIAASDAARGAVECIELVTDAAGTTANFREHPLERINRDVRVVRQHATVASHHIEDGGRVLLGLAPQGLMLNS